MQLELIFSRLTGKKSEPAEKAGSENDRPESTAGGKTLTAQCVEALQVLGLDALASQVMVEWNPRMRTTAGRAFWPCARIELNPKLLELAPDEVQPTLLHELAHLVAYARAGRRRIKAHGVEWQMACSDLGIPGELATHSLPLPGRKMKRKWRYSCPVCGQGFDRVRKTKRSVACYTCCREMNDGNYHAKFRLVEKRIEGE